MVLTDEDVNKSALVVEWYHEEYPIVNPKLKISIENVKKLEEQLSTLENKTSNEAIILHNKIISSYSDMMTSLEKAISAGNHPIKLKYTVKNSKVELMHWLGHWPWKI